MNSIVIDKYIYFPKHWLDKGQQEYINNILFVCLHGSIRVWLMNNVWMPGGVCFFCWSRSNFFLYWYCWSFIDCYKSKPIYFFLRIVLIKKSIDILDHFLSLFFWKSIYVDLYALVPMLEHHEQIFGWCSLGGGDCMYGCGFKCDFFWVVDFENT